MGKKMIVCTLTCVLLISTGAKAQMVVSDPYNLAQGILNTTKSITEVESTKKVVIENLNETQKIYKQAKEYYDALKKVNEIIKDAEEVKHTVELAKEITDMYVHNFRQISSDPLYTAEEITAISFGYGRILGKCTSTLSDLKTIIHDSSLSMTDKERLDIISRCHDRMEHYYRLLDYYTKKVQAVGLVRYQNTNRNMDGVLNLYGSLLNLN